MKLKRISALLCAAAAVSLLLGCDSQSHFSAAETDQIKNKTAGGIPPSGREAIANKQKEAQQLYLEDLKKRGVQPGSAPMPPGAPGTGAPAQSTGTSGSPQ